MMQGSGLPVPLCRSTVGADIIRPRTAAPISRNNGGEFAHCLEFASSFYFAFFALRADCAHPISGTA